MNPGHPIRSDSGRDARFGSEDAALVSRLSDINEQLQVALSSRIVIEQAKGMLAERHRLSIDDAFALLRYSARSSRTSLRALADAVVSQRGHTPEAIQAAIARPSRWSARTDRGDTAAPYNFSTRA